MTTRSPIPDRLRGAGLMMLVLTLPIAAMPVGLAAGANLDSGVGMSIGGNWVAILPSMLPWLAPLAAGTAAVGLLAYFGRALQAGLVVAIGWTIGLAAVAPAFAIVAGLVAYAIASGQRRMQAASTRT